jgi:hypothetical protein
VGIVTEADFVELAVHILESHAPRDDSDTDPGADDREGFADDNDGGW